MPSSWVDKAMLVIRSVRGILLIMRATLPSMGGLLPIGRCGRIYLAFPPQVQVYALNLALGSARREIIGMGGFLAQFPRL
jgi:hypothetical protein